MNHTPGPWKSDGYDVRQDGSNGTRMIADVCYTGPHHTPPQQYPESCKIKDEANARLIAESPAMLSDLELIRTIATTPHHPNALGVILEIANNRIQSATGKETP